MTERRCKYCGRPASSEVSPLPLFSDPWWTCAEHAELNTNNVIRENAMRQLLLLRKNAIEPCIEIAEQEGFDSEAVVARYELGKLKAGVEGKA